MVINIQQQIDRACDIILYKPHDRKKLLMDIEHYINDLQYLNNNFINNYNSEVDSVIVYSMIDLLCLMKKQVSHINFKHNVSHTINPCKYKQHNNLVTIKKKK